MAAAAAAVVVVVVVVVSREERAREICECMRVGVSESESECE